jgi:glycosyltransferase involved in cell wall biosynthesis
MTERLRIGIDGRILSARNKGIARYIWELCNGLDVSLTNAQFYLYSRDPINLPEISQRWCARTETGSFRKLPKSLWAVTRPGFMARRDQVDVFWGGTGFIPLIGLSARSVLSVHDLVFRLMPEAMTSRARWAMNMFFEPSLSRADTVVTNSQGTADRLRAMMGYSAAAVVRPGVSPIFKPQAESRIASVLSAYSLRRPYVLGVGTLEPRKGLDSLIKGFRRLQSGGQLRDYTLVLVGDRGWRDGPLARLLNESGPRIVWLGFVDDDELVALYSGCDVFVYPSKYEGFGMPVLEARACGARVVTSDSPELREAGGNDAFYISANEEGVISGILTAMSSKRRGVFDWHTQSWLASSAILAEALTGQRFSEAAAAG